MIFGPFRLKEDRHESIVVKSLVLASKRWFYITPWESFKDDCCSGIKRDVVPTFIGSLSEREACSEAVRLLKSLSLLASLPHFSSSAPSRERCPLLESCMHFFSFFSVQQKMKCRSRLSLRLVNIYLLVTTWFPCWPPASTSFPPSSPLPFCCFHPPATSITPPLIHELFSSWGSDWSGVEAVAGPPPRPLPPSPPLVMNMRRAALHRFLN